MNKFWPLTKINIRSNILTTLHISSKKKLVSNLLMAFLVVVIFAYIGFLAYFMGAQLKESGLQKMLILLAVISCATFSLMFGAISGFGFLFKTKDYEMLQCLPIKPFILFVSKFTGLYFTLLMYSAIIYIPFMIVFFVFSPLNIVGIVYAVFGLLFIPLLPSALGIVFGMLINFITSKVKWGSFVTIILYLVLLIGIMFISFELMNIINAMIIGGESLFETAGLIYYPLVLLSDAILKGNFLLFLAFVGINLIPALLLGFVCAKFYKQLNSFFMKSVRVKDFNFQNKSVGSSLSIAVKKELNRIFGTPLYFLNSCIGPILLIVISIVCVFNSSILFSLGEQFGGTGAATLLTIISFLILLSSPLSISISLEGESFWIYKSLPVKPFFILKAKMVAMLVIFIPPTWISTLLLGILGGFPAVEIIVLFLFSTFTCLLSATSGMFIGLKKYNLHYTNEMQVIKQSAGVFISVIMGMLITFAISILTSLNFMPVIWYMVMWSVLILGGSLLFLWLLSKFSHEELNDIV